MTRDCAVVALALGLSALGEGDREAARRHLSRAREGALSIGEQQLAADVSTVLQEV